MRDSKIEFYELHIPIEYGKAIHRIFYVVENGRSSMMENFRGLDHDTQDDVKDLICRMATMKILRSPKVKYTLKGYNYGEIRPMPHRFFFFQKCGDNIIFFEYLLKKRNSFPDSVYKDIDKKKEKYARAFEQFIQGHA
jgi:hypothetical protein